LGPLLPAALLGSIIGSVSDTEPIVWFRTRTSGTVPEISEARAANSPARPVAFDRGELNLILDLYGGKVAAGEWRDYALDFGRDSATFSIFRRTSEGALYRIVKEPRLARRQGLYAVIAQGGMILRRGQDLAQVLRVLMRKPTLVPA
jgi:Protein of unknown function (DUF2794)